jgi:NAD+ synthase
MQRKIRHVENFEKHASPGDPMNTKQRINHITRWIKSYAAKNRIRTLVVGISGGIDSAVVSTLCAKTGLPTTAVSMPIHQSKHTHSLSMEQGTWLRENFDNVRHRTVDLTPTFRTFERLWDGASELGLANSRARLRMITLYQIAQDEAGIVVGTGNRVEDFGVGFFTKYGDGGVDISPIGDCLKTEVWDMGRALGVPQAIIDAPPTDGLWSDGRTDEDQLGMTYPELEEAMRWDLLADDEIEIKSLDKKAQKRLRRYREIRARNLHKMLPIPVCAIPVDQ